MRPLGQAPIGAGTARGSFRPRAQTHAVTALAAPGRDDPEAGRASALELGQPGLLILREKLEERRVGQRAG